MRQQWAFRLIQEWMHSSTAAFVTLTYDNEHLPINEKGVQSVNKRDIQLFMKRFRKKYGNGIRYFCISEYGDDDRYSHRPHYHMLLCNYPPMDYLLLAKSVHDIWQKETHWNSKTAEPVCGERIGYLAGYVTTRRVHPKGSDRNFMLCSRRPAIGSAYLSAAVARYHYDSGNLSNTSEYGTYPLHSYYRRKIVDDDFRERFSEVYEARRKAKLLRQLGKSEDEIIKVKNFEDIQLHNAYKDYMQSWVEHFRKKQKHKHVK